MDRTDKEILIGIDRYIRGDLNHTEIDSLWEKFLETPEYFDWFETELHLRKFAQEQNGNGNGNGNPGSPLNLNQSPNGSNKIGLTGSSYGNWILGVAAIVILAFGVRFFLTDPGPAAYDFTIDRIDYIELAGADITRSDIQSTEESEVVLNQGIALAYNGDEMQAAEMFKSVLNQSSDQGLLSRAGMNIGIVYYNMGKYTEAAVHFENAASYGNISSFFEEKALWFLGNAYLNMNQMQKASEALHRVKGFGGRYETDAAAFLQRMDETFENESSR